MCLKNPKESNVKFLELIKDFHGMAKYNTIIQKLVISVWAHNTLVEGIKGKEKFPLPKYKI